MVEGKGLRLKDAKELYKNPYVIALYLACWTAIIQPDLFLINGLNSIVGFVIFMLLWLAVAAVFIAGTYACIRSRVPVLLEPINFLLLLHGGIVPVAALVRVLLQQF